ncbi:DUF4132 domain-containing protein [Actinoplanes sp. CA-252034]|uniref:DUF4132 domain-containing protein n=1 Tax=Actinoplanes sp. CA-252034 TaxID=3239906 RepID=UPI003D98FFFD
MTEVVGSDTFVVPSAWKRFVLPRRGAAPSAPKPGAADVRAAEELLTAFDGDVRTALRHRLIAGDLAGAGHGYLEGGASVTPLGAAVVARGVAGALPWSRRDEPTAFADFWRARHGLAFAAAATVELAGFHLGSSPSETAITRSLPDADANGAGTRLAVRMGYHLRRAVVAAPAEEYAAVVTALAGSRGPALSQQALVSVIAPDETAWADEICATVSALGGREALKGLLLTVVSAEPYASGLAAQLSPWAALSENERIYTFTATLGPAAAPALAAWLDATSDDAQYRRKLLALLALLAAVGGDTAFNALIERTDQPDVPGALSDAAGRDPARALRLFAEAPAADRLLQRHLANHRALAAEVRPSLSEAAAVRFDAAHGVLLAVDSDTAAPEELPPILVTPPWLAPVARKPLVVTGLTGDDPVRVAWAPGEREAWAAGTWAARHGGAHDWAAVARRLGTSASNGWDEIDLFLRGPDDVTLPLVSGWRPSYLYDAAEWGAELLARYGAEAVPPLVDVARRAPATAARLLAPVTGPEIASLMAGWLARVRSARPVALTWFARHTTAAARALVPVAVGRTGQARSDAEGALRAMAGAGHDSEVRAAAAGLGPEASAAVEEILAVDPLTLLPSPMPSLPDWAGPATMPGVLLTGGRGRLPVESIRHLLTMLLVSRLDSPYPGLALVEAECEPTDLAELVWTLFTEWREAGHPAKQNWALDALGLLGDDETVRRLAPVIRAWPGEGGHTRAVAGLDVLAAIGTDVALMYLHGIAQEVKFRALKERAGEKIAELAAELGLTTEELADRLVPDLGLDAAGSLVLDYGRRTFTVGFDEQLKPFVADATGKRLKALPKPGAQDDPVLAPEAYQRFTALKKDVRAIATDQVRRLEQAMVGRRRWTGAAFRQFLAGHPLLRHLVRRLVWVRFDAAGHPGAGLRPAEDGSLADVTDETVTLGDEDQVGIAHPLHLGDDLAAWAEIFADYEILQPFPQLGREVDPLTSERAAALVGRRAPSTTLLGLERRGWRRGSPQDAGVQGWFERDLPGGLQLVVAIDPGIAVGAIDVLGDQTVEAIFVATAGAHHWFRPGQDDRLRELDPITAAEALRDLTEVLA